MKGAMYKTPYVPRINFVIQDDKQDPHRLTNDLHIYVWLLRRRHSFFNQHLSLRHIALSQPLYKRKDEEEFIESLQNISRHMATHLLEIFSDLHEGDSENDVVKSAERIVHKGIDAPVSDHILIANIAEQLRQIPQFA